MSAFDQHTAEQEEELEAVDAIFGDSLKRLDDGCGCKIHVAPFPDGMGENHGNSIPLHGKRLLLANPTYLQ